MRPTRNPLMVRGLSAVAILAIAAAGAGLPMCVSVRARTTIPCAMHTKHAASPAHHIAAATVSATPSGPDSCDGGAQGPGCAAGGICPSGGTGALIALEVLGVAAPDNAVVFAPIVAHASYVAPPPPPPPQV